MINEERPDQREERERRAAPESEPASDESWVRADEEEGAERGEEKEREKEREERKIDIDFLLDLPLQVSVEAGRRKMPIGDLLKLNRGSVIVLDKEVGEPFEVYVNGKLMGYGEVVVVNEKFGLRLTEVIDPKERVKKLG